MSIANTLKRALKRVEALTDDPVLTYRSYDYACSVSNDKRIVRIDSDGNPVEAAIVFHVRKELLSDVAEPKSGNLVTHASKVYRIESVEDRDSFYILACLHKDT